MIELIVGIVMSIITQIAKKTEIDAKIIILALSVIFGTVFYFVKESYPDLVNEVWQKTL
jgi:predicted neutral ceramidase superfamily lipid hydrolase